MKKVFKYIGAFLTVAILGAFTACTKDIGPESAETGLKIKVFSPTKVVAGQPMTINGHGFTDVKEIVFPDNVVVTNFERVSGEMIRVKAPKGISPEGGKLILRTADAEVESGEKLTLGNTVVSGYSKQAGESIKGGELLTVFGKDLEFLNGAELLDSDGLPMRIEDDLFYRKGTNSAIITVPKKVFEGTFAGKLFTIDGKEFVLPELAYEPAPEEEGGHMEIVQEIIWENDGTGDPVSWSGQYRYACEGHETGEEIAIIDADTWARLKSETFYLVVAGEDPQIRVTTGWWTGSWCDKDFQPGNDDRLVDNGDGTWTLEINLSDASFLDLMDEQHLLFTGDRFTPLKFYFEKEEWHEGGGHWETVKTPVWTSDGTGGPVSWSGQYRFACEGHETGEEIAIIDADTWAKLKSETFYLLLEGEDPQVRVTTGWWTGSWCDKDFQPGNDDRLVDNGDGTWTLEINLSDASFLDLMDEQHLLFTGDRFTPLEFYFAEEVWVGGGGGGKTEVVVWEGDGSAGPVSWSGQYRFACEGHETGEEIAIIDADTWAKLKSETFYLDLEGEDPQVRVTTGWWTGSWCDKDFQPGNDERLVDNGDGTWTLEINLSDASFLDLMDEQHLLFTGDRFTPLKFYFLQ